MDMSWVKSDGGRAAAGYTGKAGDCVARAIAIVTGRPYAEVYNRLAAGMGSQRKSKHHRKSSATARAGITTGRKWFKEYMRELGFTWHPTMLIGQGCKVHLRAGELPPGRLIAVVSNHSARPSSKSRASRGALRIAASTGTGYSGARRYRRTWLRLRKCIAFCRAARASVTAGLGPCYVTLSSFPVDPLHTGRPNYGRRFDIYVGMIEVLGPLRQGTGGRMLRRLCRRADAAGFGLWLVPTPRKGFPKEAMEAWYERHGWRRLESGWWYRPPTNNVRLPAGLPPRRSPIPKYRPAPGPAAARVVSRWL